MHYRMNLDNLRQLAERLHGYVQHRGYGITAETLPVTSEFLLTMMDSSGAPLIILDVDAFSYDEECLSLIAQALKSIWRLEMP